MEVTADTDRCIGAGQCVLSAPEVFDQNDVDGRVVVMADAPSLEQVGGVRQAADHCPAQAIFVSD